jgi:predicted aminopeptidase
MRLLFLFILQTPLFAGQSLVHYAVKQGLKQGSLLLSAQKVESILINPLTSQNLIRPLKLSQEILHYAQNVLGMKVGASYKKYVELNRDWVTKVVFAAHRDRLEAKKFEFPIVGSFPYKGFFDEEDAQALSRELSEQFDVYQRKAIAFSGIGWFDDPLTSNLLARDSLLIDTLFHELVHLNFYFEDQADFNEAFATWFSYKVSRDFIEKSLYVENKPKTLSELEQEEKADSELYSFLREVLERGEEFYVKKPLPKRELFFDWVSGCTKKYTHLKSLQNVKWNNAAILSLSTYLKLLPLIDKYAEREKLTPQEFLSKVKQEKESLVNIIQAQELGTSSFRCNEKLP